MTATPHLDDLLSAYLDGELVGDDIASVEAHVAECATCRAELDATAIVRARVREAPAVDPPFGFLERLTRPRRRARVLAPLSAVAAIAAAWILVLGFTATPDHPAVEPPVGTARAALTSQPGFRATALKGRVAWSTLQGGLRHRMDGVPGTPWESSDPFTPVAIVFEVEGTGVLVVGQGPPADVEKYAAEVSDSFRPTFIDRVRDAAWSMVEAF